MRQPRWQHLYLLTEKSAPCKTWQVIPGYRWRTNLYAGKRTQGPNSNEIQGSTSMHQKSTKIREH